METRLRSFRFARVFEKNINIEYFFRVYIASSKNSGVGRILEIFVNSQLRLEFI